MSLEQSDVLVRVLAGTSKDGGPELVHQPEVIPVVPDLRDLAVVAEAEDVDAREVSPSPRRCETAPAARVCTGSSPASRDQVVLREYEIDPPPKIGERVPELLRDARLPGGSGSRLRRAKIVTHVVVGEDLCGEADVPTGPDLLVEAHDESLVGVGVHLYCPSCANQETHLS